MPDAIGTTLTAFVASPLGASELLVGLLVGLFMITFAVRGPEREDEPESVMEPFRRLHR